MTPRAFGGLVAGLLALGGRLLALGGLRLPLLRRGLLTLHVVVEVHLQGLLRLRRGKNGL